MNSSSTSDTSLHTKRQFQLNENIPIDQSLIPNQILNRKSNQNHDDDDAEGDDSPII